MIMLYRIELTTGCISFRADHCGRKNKTIFAGSIRGLQQEGYDAPFWYLQLVKSCVAENVTAHSPQIQDSISKGQYLRDRAHHRVDSLT